MSIYDKNFRYVRSTETDISKTFERVRAELKAKADAAAKNEAEAKAKTVKMKRSA